MPPSPFVRGFSAACRNIARLNAALGLLAIFHLAAPQTALAQFTTGSPDIVISQIYTRGGEAGATYQSDYVELFNRSGGNVDINGWAMQVQGFEGQPTGGVMVSFV